MVANLEADGLIAQSMIFDSVIAASYRGRKDRDYCFNGTFCNECTFMIQGWIKGNETRRKWKKKEGRPEKGFMEQTRKGVEDYENKTLR